METRRDVFQAIADPTRRSIILLLTVGSMKANSIADHFKSSRQAVSKHLRILTECNIVQQEQQGREIYYQLNAYKMHEIEKWLKQFKLLLAKRFNQLDNVLQKVKSKKKNEQFNFEDPKNENEINVEKSFFKTNPLTCRSSVDANCGSGYSNQKAFQRL